MEEEDKTPVGLRINLLDSDGIIIGDISGDLEESFTLDTFASLAKAHAYAGKSFVIAEVVTRDKERPNLIHRSYYSAHHLNKILFKRGRYGEQQHRYHRNFPITVINPLTNSEILGEVAYYSVAFPPLSELDAISELPSSPASSSPAFMLRSPTTASSSVPPAVSCATTPLSLSTPSLPRAASAIPVHMPFSFAPASSADNSAAATPVSSRAFHHNRNDSQRLSESSTPMWHQHHHHVGGDGDGVGNEPKANNSSVGVVSVLIEDPVAEGGCQADDAQSAQHQDDYDQFSRWPRNLLTAKFIGTDYNFVHSRVLRKIFDDNALTPSLRTFIEPDALRLSSGDRSDGADSLLRALARLAPQMVEQGAVTPSRRSVIRVPYGRAVILGSIASLYVLTCIIILTVAILNLCTTESARHTDWYWSFLPLFSFTTDRVTALVYQVSEPRAALPIKFLLWAVYIILPTAILNLTTLRDILNIVFSVTFLCYSFMWYLTLGRHKSLI
eukprot:jgi/Chlat1/5478/Chrsp36S05431